MTALNLESNMFMAPLIINGVSIHAPICVNSSFVVVFLHICQYGCQIKPTDECSLTVILTEIIKY
jgi:hypothetical protein